jgi:hypothetical protein
MDNLIAGSIKELTVSTPVKSEISNRLFRDRIFPYSLGSPHVRKIVADNVNSIANAEVVRTRESARASLKVLRSLQFPGIGDPGEAVMNQVSTKMLRTCESRMKERILVNVEGRVWFGVNNRVFQESIGIGAVYNKIVEMEEDGG